jgi:hypothetical protein
MTSNVYTAQLLGKLVSVLRPGGSPERRDHGEDLPAALDTAKLYGG